jgi:poly(3-hydroxybutyrate) depolymerase
VRREHHHLEAKGAGHYGIFSGRRWREVVYPHVRAFILEHEGKTSKSVKTAVKPKRIAAKKASVTAKPARKTAARRRA